MHHLIGRSGYSVRQACGHAAGSLMRQLVSKPAYLRYREIKFL